MKTTLKRTLASFALIALIAPTLINAAGSTNRNLPFVVEADNAVYTDIEQTSQFSGNVILTQGTMVIHAANVETIVDPEGYQYATAKGGNKGLVHFRQKREGTNEWIDAYGEELIYDGKQNLIHLRSKAIMRRSSPAGKLIDEIKGDELVYNQLTEVFESKNIPGASGRTKVIITPNSNASEK